MSRHASGNARYARTRAPLDGRRPFVEYGMNRVDQIDGLQPGEFGGLQEASLGQRDPMVDEVPVARSDQPDVRLEDDHPAAGSEQISAATRNCSIDRVARLAGARGSCS